MSVDGLHVGVLICFLKGVTTAFSSIAAISKVAILQCHGPWLFNNTGHKMMESRNWYGKEMNIRIRNTIECRIAKCLLIV